jgi:L-2-hydroxyglutarate oxidase LhgO
MNRARQAVSSAGKSMNYSVDAAVVGAGVVGLAIGRALALQGMETLVLEQATCIGSETSSRNSEVIHAGIYYPQGSLKAQYCVRGKELLYDYLKSRNIPHSRCGKLLVAQHASKVDRLADIEARAKRCGVDDLVTLSRVEIQRLEPLVESEAGLFSPSTGIFDSHQFMLSLQADLEAAGGLVVLSNPVTGGKLGRRGKHTVVSGKENQTSLKCGVLINASGLSARDTWLKLAGKNGADLIPGQYFAKGHYYSYSGRAPFSHLVYPLPESGGLGIHATLDLSGQVRFGPDVRWTKRRDYDFDDSAREEFIRSICKYFPTLESDRLQPAYTGIRSKVVAPGAADGDFMILTEKEHGISGYVSLHGIESPGLTASMAIAEDIVSSIQPA